MAGKLAKRILMCSPDYFTVKYKINVHMKTGVDGAKAMKQWQNLKSTLELCGANVEVMGGVPELPDIVFTANAAVVRGSTAYLAHFKHKERQAERGHYKKWFESAGFSAVGSTEIFNEGAGDALFAGPDRLFAAHGLRTEFAVYADMVVSLGGGVRVVECELVDPRWYHIDTAFCPIRYMDSREDAALWYPYAFSEESRKRMENEIELIAVSEKDAMNFACNMVVVGKNSILHTGSTDANKSLEKAGQVVHPVDMSEFIKAGGSAKCLTLALN